MYVDFAFLIAPDILCVSGWTVQKSVHEAQILTSATDVVEATHYFSHRREDVAGEGGRGFFAIFETPDLATATGKVSLIVGEKTCDLTPDDFTADFQRFVEQSVFETFFELLHAFGARLLPEATVDQVEKLTARLAGMSGTSKETKEMYLALDSARIVTDQPLGFFEGWHLVKDNTLAEPSIMVLGSTYLSPTPVMLKSITRADLGVFRDRYLVSGIDGFSGMFDHSGQPEKGPTSHVVIVARNSDGPVVVVRPTEEVDYKAYARQAIRLKTQANRPFSMALAPVAPDSASLRVLADAGDVSARVGITRTTLVLDHDASDSDLRDILRHVIASAPGITGVHILRPVETREMTMAIAGAAREYGQVWDGTITISTSQSLQQMAQGVDALLFASSSALFQFEGWADMVTEPAVKGRSASVLVYDPLLQLSRSLPSLGDISAHFFKFDPPFIALLRLRETPPQVTEFVSRFITPAGQLRALLWALTQAEAVDFKTVDNPYYYAGLRQDSDEAASIVAFRKFDSLLISELQGGTS